MKTKLVGLLTGVLLLPWMTAIPVEKDSARILDITLQSGRYIVKFETEGFQPRLPGQHVHFFFDTVPPEEAGLPSPVRWKLYGGPSPFTEYTEANRPAGASQMCVLVANPDHTVKLGTGNCVHLP